MRTQRPAESRRVPYNDADPSCERTLVVLRIYGGGLEPAEITSRLGIQPTSSQSRGEVFENSLGRRRVANLAGWFLSTEHQVTSKDLRRHLDYVLEVLAPRADALRSLQAIEGVTMDINCIWWSGGGAGPTLWPEQLAGLAALDVELSFDFADYESDADEVHDEQDEREP